MTVQKVEISYRTVVFTVFFLLGLWFLFLIRQILVLLFVSIVLMSALNPLADRMERVRIPRAVGIVFIYLIILLVFVLSLAGIIPLLVSQTTVFLGTIPDLLRMVQRLGIRPPEIGTQFGQLLSVPFDVLRLTVDIFANLLNILVVSTITFYLLLERKYLDEYLTFLFSSQGKGRAKDVVDQLEKRLGGWVRGEVMLMISVGVFYFLGFQLLGMQFALPLGVLAGLLEIIPNVGPIVSGLAAVVGGLAISPVIALAAIGWAFIVQQLEAQVLVPKIMQSVVGVNPVVSILSLLIGLKLGGIPGAILAIPLVLVLDTILREFLRTKDILPSK